MNNAIDSICENVTVVKKCSNDSFSVNIHLCDCMDFMRQYEDGYFDLAVVDPDFGLDKRISNGGTWAAKYKGFDGKLGNFNLVSLEKLYKYFKDKTKGMSLEEYAKKQKEEKTTQF